MEGRTAVRPNPAPVGVHSRGDDTSMEGRTAVRPNLYRIWHGLATRSHFNGGPDGRPAKLEGTAEQLTTALALQWRAGRPSGQTSLSAGVADASNVLQWRAGRPSGQTPIWAAANAAQHAHFNGGPDGRPAKLASPAVFLSVRLLLQWRAGRPSGQTMWSELVVLCARVELQWRAGRPSGQTRVEIGHTRRCTVTSMEGRTAVRPNVTWVQLTSGTTPRLQWRAGRPSGQTCNLSGIRVSGLPDFNGGPDGRPAKRGMRAG